jgi:HSP20 family molecular chaperone IbpA
MVAHGGAAMVVALCLTWPEQGSGIPDVAGPRTGSVITARASTFSAGFSRPGGRAMAAIRFEPLRDPFERLMSMAATGTRAPLGMPMDVYRAEDGSYHVEADLPGVDPDRVEVTVEHSTLTIKA